MDCCRTWEVTGRMVSSSEWVFQKKWLYVGGEIQDSMISMVIRVHAGQSGNQITAGAKMSMAGLWDPSNLYLLGFGGPFHQVVNLITHFYLVPRWRMSGAIPLLQLCAYMEYVRTNVPVRFRQRRFVCGVKQTVWVLLCCASKIRVWFYHLIRIFPFRGKSLSRKNNIFEIWKAW